MEDRRGERAFFPSVYTTEYLPGHFPACNASLLSTPEKSQAGDSMAQLNKREKVLSNKVRELKGPLIFRSARFFPNEKRASKIPRPKRRNAGSSFSSSYYSRMKKLEEEVDKLREENFRLTEERKDHTKNIDLLYFNLKQMQQAANNLEVVKHNCHSVGDGESAKRQVTPSPEHDPEMTNRNTRPEESNQIVKSLQFDFEKVTNYESLKKNVLNVKNKKELDPDSFGKVGGFANDNTGVNETSPAMSIKSTSPVSIFSYASHASEFDSHDHSLRRRKVASLKIQKDRLEKEFRSRVLNLELDKLNMSTLKKEIEVLDSLSVGDSKISCVEQHMSRREDSKTDWRGANQSDMSSNKQVVLVSPTFSTNTQALTPLPEE
mmetsp:Transcript_9147/g.13549  ORF Transcript_9147/g.13549 Transcript_9147/m.13549 type:complete len:377 (+) Transcript_9147:1-1131(+)